MTAIFFYNFVDDCMRNNYFGIGVLHVKRQILTYFFVTSFICSLKFLLFHRIEYPMSAYEKKLKDSSCHDLSIAVFVFVKALKLIPQQNL